MPKEIPLLPINGRPGEQVLREIQPGYRPNPNQPGSPPADLAWPMAAWRAITWPLIAGEISLPNSTVKAVSPQER